MGGSRLWRPMLVSPRGREKTGKVNYPVSNRPPLPVSSEIPSFFAGEIIHLHLDSNGILWLRRDSTHIRILRSIVIECRGHSVLKRSVKKHFGFGGRMWRGEISGDSVS